MPSSARAADLRPPRPKLRDSDVNIMVDRFLSSWASMPPGEKIYHTYDVCHKRHVMFPRQGHDPTTADARIGCGQNTTVVVDRLVRGTERRASRLRKFGWPVSAGRMSCRVCASGPALLGYPEVQARTRHDPRMEQFRRPRGTNACGDDGRRSWTRCTDARSARDGRFRAPAKHVCGRSVQSPTPQTPF